MYRIAKVLIFRDTIQSQFIENILLECCMFQCFCKDDQVRISMDVFVKKFQAEKFEHWKAGKDLASHPEDDQRKLYPNMKPSSRDNGLPEK